MRVPPVEFAASPAVATLPSIMRLIRSCQVSAALTASDVRGLISNEEITTAAHLALVHELSCSVSSRDALYRAVTPGALPLVYGRWGSLCVRAYKKRPTSTIITTAAQDTYYLPIVGEPLDATVMSLARDTDLAAFDVHTPITRNEPFVLSPQGDAVAFTRKGYDAVLLQSRGSSLVAELRLGAEGETTWILDTRTAAPVRALLNDAELLRREMLLHSLNHLPHLPSFFEHAQTLTHSDNHFLRWAAYRYLLSEEGAVDHYKNALLSDPHPAIRNAGARLQLADPSGRGESSI